MQGQPYQEYYARGDKENEGKRKGQQKKILWSSAWTLLAIIFVILPFFYDSLVIRVLTAAFAIATFLCGNIFVYIGCCLIPSRQEYWSSDNFLQEFSSKGNPSISLSGCSGCTFRFANYFLDLFGFDNAYTTGLPFTRKRMNGETRETMEYKYKIEKHIGVVFYPTKNDAPYCRFS